MFRIGEFSRMGQVSIKALRYYDEIGLLRPALVDRQTGYRYYSIEQLPLLNRILAYRNLGFSLDQSRTLLRDDISTNEMRHLLHVRRAQLSAAIEQQREQLNEVESRIMEIERRGRPARYEVLLKNMGPRMVVSLRRTVRSYDAVDGLLTEIRRDFGDRYAVEGYGAVWHRCLNSGSTIECEAFAVIKEPPLRSLVEVQHLPASSMACVVHDQLGDTPSIYTAARERTEAMGYEISGPMHEIYFPAVGSAFVVTETQFPIRPARVAGVTAQHN